MLVTNDYDGKSEFDFPCYSIISITECKKRNDLKNMLLSQKTRIPKV